MIEAGGSLQVTRNLPPLQGGMERLNARIAGILAGRGPLSVVGPAGCAAHLPAGTEVLEAPVRPLARHLAIAGLRAWSAVRRRPPSLVLAGSGLMAPLAWFVAPRGSLRVAYVHGLDLVVDHWLYRRAWRPFLRRMDLVLANSANTARLAEAAGIRPERVRILHPGTTLPAPDPTAGAGFRDRHGLGARPLLLSVGRLTPRKGLRAFVERCLPGLVARHPGLQLLVIGGEASDALSGGGGSERARIASAAAHAGVAEAVRFLPGCDDAELSAAYEACDLHVFPVLTLPGDVEGFGMVAVEAAAHGLPTLGFSTGGVPDAVVPGVTGELVAEQNFAALAEGIGRWLALARDPAVRQRCRSEAARWSWDRFAAELGQLLDKARLAKGGST